MSAFRRILAKSALVALMAAIAVFSAAPEAEAAMQCGMICVDECPYDIPPVCDPCFRVTICHNAPRGVCQDQNYVLDCVWDQ